jgi:hypothetical protein
MNVTARAQALFVSHLQPSERPTPRQVAAAVEEALRRADGATDCLAAIAAEYGEHPEAAAARMRWALATVAASAPTVAKPAAPGRPVRTTPSPALNAA